MARYHKKLRAKIEAAVHSPGPVRAVVLLNPVGGSNQMVDGHYVEGFSADAYVQQRGLDPTRRVDADPSVDLYGDFGLVCALTDSAVDFLYASGANWWKAVVSHVSTHPLGEVEVAHELVNARTNYLIRFTFSDGQYFFGTSSALPRIGVHAANNPKDFIGALGDRAIEDPHS